MSQINYSLVPREDILKRLPKTNFEIVLDVGCANGVFGKALKDLGAKKVIGIEKDAKLAKDARNNIDVVYLGDVESNDFHFNNSYFDLIVLADVLEHLKDPEKFLRGYKRYLKKDGKFIISIPNVQYYFVLWSLIKGEWKYVDRGIFDKTHLRFFTLKSIKRLLQSCGLEIVQINRNYRLREKYCSHQRLAKYVSLFFFRNFLTFQYVIIARKK